jgi:hypothetical protein
MSKVNDEAGIVKSPKNMYLMDVSLAILKTNLLDRKFHHMEHTNDMLHRSFKLLLHKIHSSKVR